MMYIYVDNFRGFCDTLIPIKDVNFLVGENSTGKTSLLSLIHVLYSISFWIGQQFNSEEVKMGSFRDIVSIASDNKEYFKVGFIDWNDKVSPSNLETISAFLFKFVEKDGLPDISRCSYVRKQLEVKIAFSKKMIKYRTAKIPHGNNTYKDILSIIKKLDSEEVFEKGYTTVKGLSSSDGKANLAITLHLIESQATGGGSGRRRFPFSMPRFPDLIWIGPIRSRPKRTYDELKPDSTPEGDHTPYLVKRILLDQKNTESFKRFIKNFGANSGLFSSISIKRFGKGLDSPFRLDVTLAKNPLSIDNVGYGVSQSLPVVVELFTRAHDSWYAIQQPEVHLHPRAQAALGDIFYYFATKEKKKFLIETHSEYLVDRYRMNHKKDREDNDLDSQVLFFERTNGGNKVHSISISKSGKYSEDQPKSFQDFFVKEDISLLELE